MLRRLVNLLRPAPATAEDLEARAEAQEIKEQLKTQATGGYGVPAGRLQGGKSLKDPY